MADSPFFTEQPKMNEWLYNLGFVRGNPFATAEAEQERSLLPEFFVDFEEYEQIKRGKISLVSAKRGHGKSAVRVMLASQAAPNNPQSNQLAVEYIDFDPLVAKCRNGQKPSMEDHLFRLLRAGSQTLLHALCGRPEERSASFIEPQRASNLSRPDRFRLAHYLRAYNPGLISPEALFEQLAAFDEAIHLSWDAFLEAANARRLSVWLDQMPAFASQPIPDLMADLNDAPDANEDPGATSKDKIAAFYNLVQSAGFETIVFLIDRLDEQADTTANPEIQADILEPLLAHLPVLEAPGLAFKIMLPEEACAILIARPELRLDRLAVQFITLSWSQNRLKRLLDDRLAAYSNGHVHDLIEICQDTPVKRSSGQSERRLGEWVEKEIINFSLGSPRRLLLACQILFQVHISRTKPTGLIEEQDWQETKRRLRQKTELRQTAQTHKSLHLFRDRRIARIGDQEIHLSKQQHQILLTLAEANGICQREKLVNSVWGGPMGISDQAVDQAMARLRKTLGDHTMNPIYLHIEKGTGFRLSNYVYGEEMDR